MAGFEVATHGRFWVATEEWNYDNQEINAAAFKVILKSLNEFDRLL